MKAQSNQVAQLNLTLVNLALPGSMTMLSPLQILPTGAGAGKNPCDVSQHYPERRGQTTQINLRHAASLATLD